MPMTLVNPLDETRRPRRAAAPRLATLSGKTVTLLDISKPGGAVFLDRLAALLTSRYGVMEVRRLAKPTYAKPAPADVIARLTGQHCDAVVEALAD